LAEPHPLTERPERRPAQPEADPAVKASRYCIRRHTAVVADYWFNSLYNIRALPSHATELAATYLDRTVAGVLSIGRLCRP